MEDHYLNEFHRKHSEAAGKEIDEMMKHPYSYEQALEQVQRIHRESQMAEERKKGRKKNS